MTVASAPSPAHLLSAPLPGLLAELDAEMVDSAIDDGGFFGAVVQRRDGRIILAMPQGRPASERNLIARGLLGNILGVDLSPLPSPVFEEVGA